MLAALRRATPFLRGEIASRCGLRAVPELLFYYDSAPQRAARIDELLRKIAEERGETEPTSAAAPQRDFRRRAGARPGRRHGVSHAA